MVDQVIATNGERRQTTDAAADTYGQWCVGRTGDQAPRFATYFAALD